MRHYFYILFGGLCAILTGVLIAYGGALAWNTVRHSSFAIHLPKLPSMSTVASAVVSVPKDGTVISGITRYIRFTASEEEDLIGAAERALPKSGDTKITADAYLVKNLVGGDIPATHNADRLLPIASLTKLVTAVVAKKYIDPSDKIKITPEIVATYGNTAGFKSGETFTAKDLLYPLLMVSSNDAAEAFARYYGRTKFVGAMNDFTQSIGAYRTYFADPSGLSEKNVSTANDLSIIMDWIRKNEPDILAITEEKSKTIRAHTFVNPTHFLNWSNYLGGKNGYTPEADRTAVALFSIGGLENVYSVVLLGSSSRDNDVVKLLAKIGK